MSDPKDEPLMYSGEFSMLVRTRAHVEYYGDPTREGCEYISELRPDTRNSYVMAHPTLSMLRDFIAEFEPREVRVACMPDEDREMLEAALARKPAGGVTIEVVRAEIDAELKKFGEDLTREIVAAFSKAEPPL